MSYRKRIYNDANFYAHLPPRLIHEIIQERDVDVGFGSLDEQIRLLSQLDLIIPDWKQEIIQTDLTQLNRLSLIQIYVFAQIFGISAHQLYTDGLSKKALVEVIPAIYYGQRIQSTISPVDVHPIENVVKNLTDFLSFAAQGNLPYIENPTIIFPHTDRDSIHQVLLRAVQYPILLEEKEYLHLRQMNRNHLEYAVIKCGADKGIASVLSREELIFTLSRGYLPPISERVEKSRRRYQQIQELGLDERNLLYALYDLEEDPNKLIEVVKMENCHPLEEFIFCLDKIPSLTLAQNLGMIIPPHLNPRRYYLDNLFAYRYVANRKVGLEPPTRERYFKKRRDSLLAYLEEYTDLELFAGLGLYLNYESRSDLIHQLINLRNQKLFFIPYQRDCQNKETFLFNSTADSDLFLIAYGTLSSYWGYEPDELKGSFQFKERDFFFLRPEDQRSTFKIEEIRQLYQLIQLFPQECSELKERITQGLEECQNKTDYDRELFHQLRSISSEDRDLIREYLYTLFQAGMYMRKWKGPGYPYPIREEETKKGNSDDQSTEALSQIRALFDQMSNSTQLLLYSLRVVEYYKDGPQQSKSSIWDYLLAVGSGAFCIRMASTKFVGTGYYYLKNFFDQIIPDCDIKNLDTIY